MTREFTQIIQILTKLVLTDIRTTFANLIIMSVAITLSLKSTYAEIYVYFISKFCTINGLLLI